jgi:hypothetical protein
MRIPKGVMLGLALCLRCDAHHKKALFHFAVGREQVQNSAAGGQPAGGALEDVRAERVISP